MIDLKKKYWREKVTAEITVAHVLQFARELGTNMSAAEVAAFLNQEGRAQSVWMHMMQAGEEYIKSSLETKPKPVAIHSLRRTPSHAGLMPLAASKQGPEPASLHINTRPLLPNKPLQVG